MAQVTPQYPVLQRTNVGVVLVEHRNEQSGDKELVRIETIQLMPVMNAPTPIAELVSVMDAATGAALDITPFVVKADQITPQTFLDHNVVRIPNFITIEQFNEIGQIVSTILGLSTITDQLQGTRGGAAILDAIDTWTTGMNYTKYNLHILRRYKPGGLSKDPYINGSFPDSYFFILIGKFQPLTLQNKTNKVTIRLNNAERDLIFISNRALKYYDLKTGANSKDKRDSKRLIFMTHPKSEDNKRKLGVPLTKINPVLPPTVPPVIPVGPTQMDQESSDEDEPTINIPEGELTDAQIKMIEDYFSLMTLESPTKDRQLAEMKQQLRNNGIID